MLPGLDPRWAFPRWAINVATKTLLGFGANVGPNGTAIGANSQATGSKSVALGDTAQAPANFGTAVGPSSVASVGGYATAIGGSAQAKAAWSTSVGGFSQALYASSVAVGYSAKALETGGYSVALGANAQISGSGYGSVALGYNGQVNGVQSIGIGYYAYAFADYAVAIGGNAQATSPGACSLGYNARNQTGYSLLVAAYGNGPGVSGPTFASSITFAGYPAPWKAAYDNTQLSQVAPCVMLSRQTVNNTATELYLDGTSQRLVIPPPANNALYTFHGFITAQQGANCAVWEVKAAIQRAGAGNVALVGVPTVTQIFTAGTVTGWAVAITADTVNQSLKLGVTGPAAANCNWLARLATTELAS